MGHCIDCFEFRQDNKHLNRSQDHTIEVLLELSLCMMWPTDSPLKTSTSGSNKQKTTPMTK